MKKIKKKRVDLRGKGGTGREGKEGGVLRVVDRI